jgi:hypothetical protein
MVCFSAQGRHLWVMFQEIRLRVMMSQLDAVRAQDWA